MALVAESVKQEFPQGARGEIRLVGSLVGRGKIWVVWSVRRTRRFILAQEVV